jgi:CYTH domain-containing protein
MKLDKTSRTELHRSFLIEALPEPLTRQSAHLQLFDNYIPETRIRLRSIRIPETKEWSHILQQRFPVQAENLSVWKIAEIHLNELEYEHFKIFEGNEIRKNRYFHEFDGRVFAFDVYIGPLWGLNRAHVEFAAEDELRNFEPPRWAIYEVTNEPFFNDENLVNQKFEDVQAEIVRIGNATAISPDFPDE